MKRNLMAIGLLWIGGCGDPDLGTMRVESRRGSLLVRWDEVEVVACDPARPPRVGALAPTTEVQADAGALPAAILAPPCGIAWQLAPASGGRRLELALGLGAEAYAAGAPATRVSFRVSFGDALVAEEVCAAGAEVPPGLRGWRRIGLDVSSGGRLVLEVDYADSARPPLEAGFGLLRLVEPRLVARSRVRAAAPNLVLVVVDTLRWDGLGCYGGDEAVTPAIDELARRGTLFETAYAPSSWTWPSTASILTGASPVAHGLLDAQHCFLADDYVTLAEALQQEGVTTAAFSTNPIVAPGKNFDQGFESWSQHGWVPVRKVLPEVMTWLATRGEQRFFLYLHLGDPHTPYQPSAAAKARFRAQGRSVPSATLLSWVESRVEGGSFPRGKLQAEVEEMQRLYRAEVLEVDLALERIAQFLAESGLADRTVVALTSDHGEEFLEHDQLGHGNQLHDESVRVPLLLAGPGVPAGRRVRAPVEIQALAATLLGLARVPLPQGMPATDLLDGAWVEEAAQEPFFFVVRNATWPERTERRVLPADDLFAVQRGSLRLHWSPEAGGRPRAALFDLEADPEARVDLAESRVEEVRELERLLERWRESELERRPRLIPGGDAAARELEQMGYGGGGD